MASNFFNLATNLKRLILHYKKVTGLPLHQLVNISTIIMVCVLLCTLYKPIQIDQMNLFFFP